MPRSKSVKAAQPPTIPSVDKALRCARLALEKKASEVIVLNIGPLSSIAEYFLICSAKSVRQTRAIADHVQSEMKKIRQLPLGVEGAAEGSWILLDYDDVVVHVFHEPTREHYALEKLWSDAARVAEEEFEASRQNQGAPPGGNEEDEDWEA